MSRESRRLLRRLEALFAFGFRVKEISIPDLKPEDEIAIAVRKLAPTAAVDKAAD